MLRRRRKRENSGFNEAGQRGGAKTAVRIADLCEYGTGERTADRINTKVLGRRVYGYEFFSTLQLHRSASKQFSAMLDSKKSLYGWADELHQSVSRTFGTSYLEFWKNTPFFNYLAGGDF